MSAAAPRGQATFLTFPSSTSSSVTSSSSGINTCFVVSLSISMLKESVREGCGAAICLEFRNNEMILFSSGSGQKGSFLFAVTGINRLRKPMLAFVHVLRLISA